MNYMVFKVFLFWALICLPTFADVAEMAITCQVETSIRADENFITSAKYASLDSDYNLPYYEQFGQVSGGKNIRIITETKDKYFENYGSIFSKESQTFTVVPEDNKIEILDLRDWK